MAQHEEHSHWRIEMIEQVVQYLKHKYGQALAETALAETERPGSETTLRDHAVKVIAAVERLADANYRSEPDLEDLAEISIEINAIKVGMEILAGDQSQEYETEKTMHGALKFLYKKVSDKRFFFEEIGKGVSAIVVMAIVDPGPGIDAYWRYRAGELVNKDDPRITDAAKDRLDREGTDDSVLVIAESEPLGWRFTTVDGAFDAAFNQLDDFYELAQSF